MYNKLLILISIIIFCFHHSVSAQNSELNSNDSIEAYQVFKLISGERIYGKVVSKHDSSLIIEKIDSERTSISKSDIKQRKQIRVISANNGKYWFENSDNIISIYSPFAFNLRKGEIFIQNNNVILNRFGYGVTDNLALYAGADLFSVMDENNAFYFMTKYYIKLGDNFHLSPSLLYIYDRGFFTEKDFGGALITLSFGNKERNIGLSSGYNILEINESRLPFYILNGKYRIVNRFAFLSEIFLYSNNSNVIFNYGFQYIMNKAALKIGFINSNWIFEHIPIGVPLIGVSFKI